VAYTLDQLAQKNVRDEASAIEKIIRNEWRNLGYYPSNYSLDIPFIEYLIYKVLLKFPEIKNITTKVISENEFGFDPIIQNALMTELNDDHIKVANKTICAFRNAKAYASAFLFFNISWRLGEGESGSPKSIISLAKKILDIKDTDSVADICSGQGDFMTSVFLENEPKSFTGYEINIHSAAQSLMRADVLGKSINIKLGDALVELNDNNDVKFDKIFANYPFGMKIFGNSKIKIQSSGLSRLRTYDWLFIDAVCQHLADNGKGVAILLDGSLSNITDKAEREYFLKNGYIEAVISLPQKLFYSTSVKTSLVIFSTGNTSVRFINADNLCSQSGTSTVNALSDDNIKTIINSLKSNENTETEFTLTNEEIENHDYSLAVKTYRSGIKEYEKSIRLGEIAEVLRGVGNYKGFEGDNTNYTGLQLLKISDMAYGMIPDELQALKEEFYKPNMARLEKNDIVISRNGTTGKVAIYEGSDNRIVIPNGNLFIIRPNVDKINPYFLLAFLLSTDGEKTIELITTGSVIKTISSASLENIKIPLESKDRQREVAEKIIAAQTELNMYRIRFINAEQKILSAFEVEGE